MKQEINVVGFDPSLTNWGIAIATVNIETGDINPSELILFSTAPDKAAKSKSLDRLRRARYLADNIRIYRPQVVFSEIPTGSQSAVASFALGIATGILATITVPIIPITPTETKLATGLSKSASKQAMINWATSLYPGLDWPTRGNTVLKKAEHLADALAVIHAGVKSDQFKQLLSIYRQANIG